MNSEAAQNGNMCGSAPPSLLAASDPAPYTLVNPEGRARLVFFCDHAGRAFPAALGPLGLPAACLDRHIAWDIGIADLAHNLARRFDAPAVLATYSRLVIDCNRRLDDPTSIPTVSDGVHIPANANLDAAARAARAQAIFTPYHAAIGKVIAKKRQVGVAPVILSLHSFTPVMAEAGRPWHIGILWNRDGRLPLPLLARLGRERDLCIGDNEPYSGRDAHGYSIQEHAERHNLAHALIEIRQDLIADAHGVALWADRLARVLDDVLQDPGLYLPAAGEGA